MTQLPLQAHPHHNHRLFADYYLDHRVAQRDEWRLADARPLLDRLTALWRAFAPQQPNEAQTEARWIRPVLDALGHHYNVQVSLRTPLGTRTPDYILYPSASARAAAPTGLLAEGDLRGALAVGDAKAWDLNLDQPIRGDRAHLRTSENPSYQIDFYIRHAGLPWGILTNGRRWRLYHKDSSKDLDTYYEVDLPALIERGDPEAFHYLYLFFRAEAFQGQPSWLDTVLEQSQAYAQKISEGLKGQVYDALQALAQGFLDYPANALQPTPETLQAIHDHSLIVLYRLLFTLYAESRGLLPLGENAPYTRRYSLDALKRRIAHDTDTAAPVVASMDSDWRDLRRLWSVLDGGNPDLGVPAYNGGLFDPANHPFLERYGVGDAHLRRAIDLLARTADPQTGRREFVDYRDLEIRHLGSIYEGLLEYRLRYAAPPSPDRGAPGPLPGQVYLATDKGERKATGSYYTPDYIVQYIVEHTVGPLLEEQRARHADAQGHITDEAALVRAILSLNVLDPAMGSGHFLVAATDYIARYLVGLNLAPPEGLGTEGEVAYWRRSVAQCCIYGVDLNPLAVELAKLSLWLATVARDKPLSFLDHHLRCGNSLIGARVADLNLQPSPAGTRAAKSKARREKEQRQEEEAARAAGQLSMLDDSAFVGTMRTATRTMANIELLRSDTLAQVHEAERLYRDVVEQTTRGHRALADVRTAQHFGLSFNEKLWDGLKGYVLHGAAAIQMPAQYQAILSQAEPIARERRFFHWELEFPEVFFDESGRLLGERGGFDAVIGNPPYDELSEYYLDRAIDEKPYLESVPYYKEAVTYRINLYRLFIASALHETKPAGIQGFIAPMSLLGDRFTFELRRKMLSEMNFLSIEAFPQKDDPRDRVFFDAKLPTCVYIVRKTSPSVPFKVRTHPGGFILTNSPAYEASSSEIGRFDPLNYTVPMLSDREWRLARRLAEDTRLQPLGEVAHTMSGEIVFNASFRKYLTKDPRHTLVLRGGHIQRYELLDEPKQGEPVYINKELWLSESAGLATTAHRRQRIVYQESAALDNWRRVIACMLPAGLICGHTICYVTESKYDDWCLLALLNSLVVEWRFQVVSTTNHLSTYQIEAIPIPRFSFTTSATDRARYAAESIAAYDAALAPTAGGAPLADTAWAPVLALVAAHLAAQPERSDVVHDLLAHLAERMMALHQERQVESKGFLTWLERELGAPLDALNNKSALQNYLGDYQKGEAHLPFEAWLGILRKSQRKIALDLGARTAQERLGREYGASLDKLLPLKARLAATDRLIDLIVYRLYGLTEEEVTVVEGRSP